MRKFFIIFFFSIATIVSHGQNVYPDRFPYDYYNMDTSKIHLITSEEEKVILSEERMVPPSYAIKIDTTLPLAEIKDGILLHAIERMTSYASKSKYYRAEEDSCSSGIFFDMVFYIEDDPIIDSVIELDVSSNYSFGWRLYHARKTTGRHCFVVYLTNRVIGIVSYNDEMKGVVEQFFTPTAEQVRLHLYRKLAYIVPQIYRDVENYKVDDLYYYPKEFSIRGGNITEHKWRCVWYD